MSQYNKAVILDEYAGLDKGWNDPDMMVIGLTGISTLMSKTHMAMWVMTMSPIMLGFDISNPAFIKKGDDLWKVIANKELIDLHQDPLGIQAKRIYCSYSDDPGVFLRATTLAAYNEMNNRIDVLAKPLANGDIGLSFINCSSTEAKSASVDVARIIEYVGHKMVNADAFKNAEEFIISDVWSKEESYNNTGVFSVTNLPAYDNITLRISPVAVARPVVTDSDSAPLACGSASFVSGAVDVFIQPEADTVYYYKIGDSKNGLEVYYRGENNNPSGSYFDGSLVNGALVLTLGDSLDYVSGTLVSGNRINVPVSPGGTALLEVIAYKGGVASKVYTHEFRRAGTSSTLYQAVYIPGKNMVSAAAIGYKANGVMDVDYSTYPLGGYFYKVFCWDDNYVPLFDAIAIY